MTWRITTPEVYDLRIGDTTTTQPTMPVGTIVSAIDPFWGGGEFMLVKTATTLPIGTIVVWDKDYLCVGVPNSAIQGRAVAILVGSHSGAATWGWAQIQGRAVAIANATVAAGVLSGITAVGGSGTLAAGKALLNATTDAPQTTTVVKANCQTVNGSPFITVPNADGWFVGVAITGTGVSGTVAAISRDGLTVQLSANSSATASGISVTGTYTGFSILALDRPMAQGPIT